MWPTAMQSVRWEARSSSGKKVKAV
jgi:hypothetical protein